ncbi:pheromone processing endoprotease [Emydomyces testavorans]|uniref:Pheromone processing endoprotease n=1 Tax=Emydomyces testavorans TaxID=2070801 RepID=A0AAF0DG96_9EURO|nr:pheromone processing endoprotease [Emydomyces testavorans]
MRLLGVLGFAWTFFSLCSASIYPRDHDTRDYVAIHLRPSLSPDRAAQLLGARHEGQIGELEDHHTFSFPKERGEELDKLLDDLRLRSRRKRRFESAGLDKRGDRDELDDILYSEKLIPRQRLQKRAPPPPPPSWIKSKSTRRQQTQAKDAAIARQQEIAGQLQIQDPIFVNQWHLFNTEQPGHDLNLTGLWLDGITGNGSITAIVDDGLDMYSHDLKDNYFAEGSYDFNDKGKEPKPRLVDDKHGTRCAGEVAAVKNNICGLGVAYDGKVAGIRILSKPVTDEDEAAAINYGFQKNQIYSCSWGPVDNGATMDAPGLLIRRAMVNGIQKGRGGKGSIYVFAAGNGAASEDNCNFDGYTNSIYSITVGAIDREDNHPYYSESCSAQLVVTYSSGGSDAISTTDVGLDSCSNRHGGTSAAGPLVVGVVALALGVRPDLTWRDVQYLIVETAIPVNLDDPGWQTTAIGKKFSHDFGYGKADAYAMVELAKSWKLVKPQAWFHSPWLKVHHDVPQGSQGLASSLEITKEMLQKSNLERIEHVTVTMNINHTRRGDLSVELKSPKGVVSYLSTTRSVDFEKQGYVDWTFMSVAHWGETGEGKWTIIVKDTEVNEFSGRFLDWRISLWGEAIDGKIQKLHPLPDAHDHDHDSSEIAPEVATTTIVQPSGSKPVATEKPSDHIDRPINAKPTGEGSASPATTHSLGTTATATAAATATASTLSDHFLPSPFPTFGVSKRTQIWIYGSIALIFIFCIALGIYFLVQRRKRLRNSPRDDYEFEMVAENEEGYPLSGAAAGGAKSKKQTQRRRRGGELYDAFAGESDEDIFSGSEEGEKPYCDDDDEDDGHDNVERTEELDEPKWSEKPRGREEPGLGS